jgi:hypothetical protein
MNEKRVVIRIGKDGSVKSEVMGAKGPECEGMTAFLDKLLGKKTTQHKPSYYEEPDKLVNGIPSGYCG